MRSDRRRAAASPGHRVPFSGWLLPAWAIAVTAVWIGRYHVGPAEWTDAFRRFFLGRSWSLPAILLNWAGFLPAVASLPGLLAIVRSIGEGTWRWLGSARSRASRVRRAGPATARLLDAHVLGFLVTASGVLGLGLAGLLYAPSAPWGTVALAAWGIADIRRRPAAWRWWGTVVPFGEAARAVSAPVRWCLGVAAAVTVAHVFGIETGWDAMTYHLRLPEIYGIRHKVVEVWHYPTVVFPALTEMLFTGVRLAGGDGLVRLLLGATAVLCLGATARLAVILGVRPGLPVVVMAASPLFLLLATRAYVDLHVVLFGAAALAGWLEWAKTGSRRAATASGLFAGAAMASKYPAALLALAVAVATLPHPGRRDWKRAAWIWIAAVAVPVVPWLARAELLRANPVHPFLSGIIGMPAARSPDIALPFEGVAADGSIFARGIGERLWALLFHDGHFDGPLAPAVAAGLPVLLLLSRAGSALGALCRGMVGFLAGWLFLCPDMRFMAPVAAALCALPAVAIAQPGSRGARAGFRVAIETGLAAAALFAAGYQWKTDAPFAMPLGLETKEDKLELGLRPAPFLAYAARAVRETVPREGRILGVCLVHTYYLEREALADVHYGKAHVTRIVEAGRTPAGIARRLRQLGIGWVLASETVSAEYAETPGYFAAPPSAWDSWRVFLSTRASVAWQTDGFVLYRIGPRHAPRLLPAAPPVDMLACLPARRALERGEARRAAGYLDEAPGWLLACGTPWMLRGGARLAMHDWGGAIESFTEAQRRGVDGPGLHLGLARALYAFGRPDEAFPHAARALELNPRSAYACGLLAVMLADRGRGGEARRLARRAVSLDPEQPEYRRLLEGLEGRR